MIKQTKITLNVDEVDLCRQWFDTLQDLNPEYLGHNDYTLANKLYEILGIMVPHSTLKHYEKK